MARLDSAAGLDNPLQEVFPQPIVGRRNPGNKDKNFPIGQDWINTEAQRSYKLAGFSNGNPVWVITAVGAFDVESLDGDSGNATPSGGIITIAGGTNITTSATGSTVTTALDANINVTSATATSMTANGDMSLAGPSSRLEIDGSTPTTASIGRVTLVLGLGIVSHPGITANDRVFATRRSEGASTALGGLSVNIQAGINFAVEARQITNPAVFEVGDLSEVEYMVVRQI